MTAEPWDDRSGDSVIETAEAVTVTFTCTSEEHVRHIDATMADVLRRMPRQNALSQVAPLIGFGIFAWIIFQTSGNSFGPMALIVALGMLIVASTVVPQSLPGRRRRQVLQNSRAQIERRVTFDAEGVRTESWIVPVEPGPRSTTLTRWDGITEVSRGDLDLQIRVEGVKQHLIPLRIFSPDQLARLEAAIVGWRSRPSNVSGPAGISPSPLCVTFRPASHDTPIGELGCNVSVRWVSRLHAGSRILNGLFALAIVGYIALFVVSPLGRTYFVHGAAGWMILIVSCASMVWTFLPFGKRPAGVVSSLTTVSLTECGVISTWDHTETVAAWDHITAIEKRDRSVMFRCDRRVPVSVPVGAFLDREHCAQFIAAAQTLRGGGMPAVPTIWPPPPIARQ